MAASPAAASTVLVADDSIFARRWAARLLAEAGHSVRTVGDGREALALLRHAPPDVLVADELVPRLSGTELVRALRGGHAESGVVLTSASADAGLEADALRLGADCFVRKPCSARTLAQAVAAAAAAGAARRARRAQEERTAGEMQAAAAVQGALLPVAPALPDGWALDVAALPARDVGGDAVDVVLRDPSTLTVIVADVSGKGVAGALLAGMFHAAVRVALGRGDDAPGALATAAAQLHEPLERAARFLTAVVADIDLRTGRVLYADAGHGHGLVAGVDGALTPLPAGGPPLGFARDAVHAAREAMIAPGDALALYTDGLVEDGGAGDPSAARDRLAASVAGGAAARDLVAAAPDADDRTVVVLRRSAA